MIQTVSGSLPVSLLCNAASRFWKDGFFILHTYSFSGKWIIIV
jgi:hypothetical protein